MPVTIYLIPTVLFDDDEAYNAIPFHVTEAIKKCNCFFVENERTSRRYLKKLWKAYLPGEEIIIDDYEWHTIHKAEEAVMQYFVDAINKNKTIGILSEAGCAGIADPGQLLINKAQQLQVKITPLTGPSSILLALMASGMNGQEFTFNGYLPQESNARKKVLKDLEQTSSKQNSTQIFIETPYRNNQLIGDMLNVLNQQTLLCIAVDITSANESIKTKTIGEWKKQLPELNKRPAIFLLYSGR